MKGYIKYRHNRLTIRSIEEFAGSKRDLSKDFQDVSFVRMLGQRKDLTAQIQAMDRTLQRQMQEGKLIYRRISSLPRLADAEDIAYYTKSYEQWNDQFHDGISTRIATDHVRACQLGEACKQTISLYEKSRAAVTDSIRKNFAVKLLFWFDAVLGGKNPWSGQGCAKVVAHNVGKEQEYLFYYFLTLTGCDVLLLQSAGDLADEGLKRLSVQVRLGEFGKMEIPRLCDVPEKDQCPAQTDRIVVKIPPRSRKPSMQTSQTLSSAQNQMPGSVQNQIQSSTQNQMPGSTQNQMPSAGTLPVQRREKSFEELAALASSIVLILVHDQDGEVIATGSGIMVGRAGYILTNDHVVRGGYSYSVRIENDEQAYLTDELIKYNPVLDLALLRIARRLAPLPVYQGEKQLMRGQAVAAIGSPLGLFNSISDGIISGFRNIDGVDMIQFTAPISSGSSGGALLNLYGEVIGISTAGFDRGQNINLAVGYESIGLFIQGFQS
ncbi:MAG: trypsin-like peptidase domain-containing protein [Eubacterium sp.]|nr:trypsin-like peptidase domain-containing protein [Eubacterium sp.]